MAGIMVAYLTVVAFVARPTNTSCCLSMYGFNLSVALIYAPMLVKTNRIYRIFSAGKKGSKRPGLIGSRAMVLISVIVIFGEVISVSN